MCAELMEYLQKQYGTEETQGVDLLWNPTNHRVLNEQDFEALRRDHNVHPWEFVQKAVSLSLLPPNCALCKRQEALRLQGLMYSPQKVFENLQLSEESISISKGASLLALLVSEVC